MRRRFREQTPRDEQEMCAELERANADLVERLERAQEQLKAERADRQEMIAEECRIRLRDIRGDLEREQAMTRDLRAIIETHNTAGGETLRRAMAAERDEAVRLLGVARAREAEARAEAIATRQFLAAAQAMVGQFKEIVSGLEDALGERVGPQTVINAYWYQS